MRIIVRGSIAIAAMILLALPAAARPASAPVSATGTIDQARYRIDIPAEWNGDLILMLHGYEAPGDSRPDPMPLSKLASALLAKGFAIAQSGYSAQGWAVDEAMGDTARLQRFFAKHYGKPRRVYAVGGSFGGHVTLALAERRTIRLDGALTYCGANVPASMMFDHVLETLVGFDTLFPGVLPLAATGLADPASPAMLSDADVDRIAKALEDNPEKADILMRKSGTHVEGLPDAIWLYYTALREMMGRAKGFPLDTRSVRYSGFGDDAAFNRDARRYAADPKAAAYLRRHADLTGRPLVPVVAIANEYDGEVPVALAPVYGALAARTGNADKVRQLPPKGSGHCRFQPEDVAAAFDVLTAWVGGEKL